MADQIALLNSEQTQEALLQFYKNLPEDFWKNGKPSLTSIEALSERIQDQASPEIEPFLNVIIEGQDKVSRGEVAKMLLYEFERQELLRPYVENAVVQAGRPHMAIVPLVIGAVIVAMIAAKYTRKTGFEWDGGRVVEFVKNLPSDLLSKILGGGA